MPEAVLAVGRRLLRERAAELLAAGLLLAMAVPGWSEGSGRETKE